MQQAACFLKDCVCQGIHCQYKRFYFSHINRAPVSSNFQELAAPFSASFTRSYVYLRAVIAEDMKKIRVCIPIYGFLIVECFIVGGGLGGRVQQKAESINPIPTLTPPEGNATFIDGTTWCVARPGASQFDLENALDWACGLGGADCSLVQPGSACYHPDTLLSHASFAFNSYYQQNGNSDIACYFGGTAIITKKDPSYGSCKYLSSETSSASSLLCRDSLKKILVILIVFGLSIRL